MKKALISIFLSIALLSPLFSVPAHAVPGNSAHSFIIMHADTGQILYKQNADEQMLIASTTKIMTALVVLENCYPDEVVKILPEYTGIEGSSMYLAVGEEYSVSDLLYGMMLTSGNDAAVALACHCGGSIEGFAKMMNDKAEALGLTNSSFKNPHGLDAEGHYASAADLATITREAMKIPLFTEIVSTKSHTVGNRTFTNHNKLLWNYEGTLGVKTGYTKAAGRSLVTCAERDGLRVICVSISDPNDWDDHKAAYDWAFSNFEYKPVLPQGEICKIPVISGESESVGVSCLLDARLIVKKDAELSYSLELPEFVYAGVLKGECAGKLYLNADGQRVAEYPLIYTSDVPLAKGIKLTVWERIRKAWFLSNKYGFVFDSKK